MEEIERDVLPFGFFDDGIDEVVEQKEDPWQVQYEDYLDF
jgi:hypothetical protein